MPTPRGGATPNPERRVHAPAGRLASRTWGIWGLPPQFYSCRQKRRLHH